MSAVEENNSHHVESSRSQSPASQHVDPVVAAAAADNGDQVTSREVFEARQKVEQRRIEHDERLRATMTEDDFRPEDLPSLQELREERVRLTEQIRHHKDEQDSLALDIEGQEGASEVYQIAARVQRFEHFAAHSKAYVNDTLPAEIDQVVEADKKHSEEEVAAYIQSLQNRRERIVNTIAATQQPQKRNDNAEVELDDQTKETLAHAQENESEANTLSDKIKKYRAIKTKLQSDIVKQKHDSRKAVESLEARTKNAQLANARDARLCKELNSGNAALTTNTQLLMSQLNDEHYGVDNAPTAQQLIEDREARDATPPPTPAVATETASRRPSANSSRASKPPLIAIKRTASQTSRDAASREERDSRRNSEAPPSCASSRRQSFSKPPLVASKPTASQTSRDAASRDSRQQSIARSSRAATPAY